MSDTADAVSLSSSTRQQQLSSLNNLLQKRAYKRRSGEAGALEVVIVDPQPLTDKRRTGDMQGDISCLDEL